MVRCLPCCGRGSVAAADPRHPDLVAAERQAQVSEAGPADDEAQAHKPQTPDDRPLQQWLPRAHTKAFQSALNVTKAESVLEMFCDHMCVRTMTVCYTNLSGKRRTLTQSGYRVKIFLPEGSRDVEVTFSVVGGSSLRKVDRSANGLPFVKDEGGNFVPEKFEYHVGPEYVQYFVRGSLFQSKVASVDERKTSESLLEMVSRDFHCVRTMRVDYMDAEGARKSFTGSGYRVACHLPSSARDVEVSFHVVGGGPVCKVDRRDPTLPFVKDANGSRPPELFCYPECPQCVQYEIRGVSWRAHISRVSEQIARNGGDEEIAPARSVGPDGRALFDSVPDMVPAVGGIVDLREAHSEYLLPQEVLLFEPTATEIFMRGEAKKGSRLIFLNTPLTEEENAALLEYRRTLLKRGALAAEDDPFPRYMGAHALRLVQSAKYNMQKAADMMKTCVTERVRRLPIAEADVIDDLRLGFAYWHGRDRNCRPCLVLKLARMGPMLLDKERAVRLVIFALEYGLRFAMVPGRVENWVVVIDMENVMSIVNPMRIGSLISTASAIGTTLEKVYCGRMVWIKIVNLPGSGMLTRAINGVIPSEKKDKIEIPTDVKAALLPHFEPNQLECRYGGTAPDLRPEETYPFRFFPNPRGSVVRDSSAMWEKDADEVDTGAAPPRKLEEGQEVEDFSLHASATLAFHEGVLWDESSDAARARCLDLAQRSTLTPEAASALTQRHGKPAKLCRSVTDWMQTVNPQVIGRVSIMRSSTQQGEDLEVRCPGNLSNIVSL